MFSLCLDSTCVYLLLDSTCVYLLQGRSLLISLPPLPENGPYDESKFVEEEDDDDEIPSAHSPHEEVEDEDEEEEPVRKKRKLPSGGDSATASSPARDADVVMEKVVATSSGAQSSGDWNEPLVVPPVSSAAPRSFAWMASPSLGSYDDLETTR